MPIIQTAAGSCYYRLDGADDKPVLVLSHSLGLDHGMWDAQIADLAPHLRLLRYDTRGHGASAAPTGDYTIDQLGRDVIALSGRARHHAVCVLWPLARRDDRPVARPSPRHAAHPSDPGQHDAARRPIPAPWTRGVERCSTAAWSRSLIRPSAGSFHRSAWRPIRRSWPRRAGRCSRRVAAGYAGCCAAIRDMDQRDRARDDPNADARHRWRSRSIDALARSRGGPRDRDFWRARGATADCPPLEPGETALVQRSPGRVPPASAGRCRSMPDSQPGARCWATRTWTGRLRRRRMSIVTSRN